MTRRRDGATGSKSFGRPVGDIETTKRSFSRQPRHFHRDVFAIHRMDAQVLGRLAIDGLVD
jgi:hypothetical protein